MALREESKSTPGTKRRCGFGRAVVAQTFPAGSRGAFGKNNTYYSKLINSGTDYADYTFFSKSTSAKAV